MATAAPKAGAFPSPYEIETPPGCEGWEEMYPYYALFDERRRDTDENRFWFWNSMHFPRPDAGVRRDLHRLAVPGGRGVAEPGVRRAAGDGHRLPVHQRLHLHLRQPGHRSGEDRRARRVLPAARGLLLRELERAVRQVAGQDGGADRASSTNLHVPDLPEYEPDEVDVRRRAQHRVLRGARRLRPRAPAGRPDVAAPLRVPAARLRRLRDVRRVLQGPPPDIPDQHIAQMVAGIDVLLFRPDAELRRLARLAIETGVDGAFVEGRTPEEIEAELAPSDAGTRLARGARGGQGPVVQHGHGRRPLPLLPQLARRPEHPVRVADRPHQRAQGRRADRPPDRGDRARARPARERVRRAARRGARRASTSCWACRAWCSRTSRSTSSSATTGS